jgi:hypothetical protein
VQHENWYAGIGAVSHCPIPRIKEVVILTKDGHCFGEESGKDFCLIA